MQVNDHDVQSMPQALKTRINPSLCKVTSTILHWLFKALHKFEPFIQSPQSVNTEPGWVAGLPQCSAFENLLVKMQQVLIHGLRVTKADLYVPK